MTEPDNGRTTDPTDRVRRAPRSPRASEPAYKREAQHYGGELPGEEPDEGRKPANSFPVRAWCTRRVDEMALFAEAPAIDAALRQELLEEIRCTDSEEWRMFLEDNQQNDTFYGEFEDLVLLAASRGTSEFFVWSPSERTFVRFDGPATLHAE